MAYQQQPHDNYSQQQYYNQGPPPQGRQPPGHNNQQYNDQYDNYGYDQAYDQEYDQAQYGQWYDSYHGYHGQQKQQQQQHAGWDNGHGDANGHTSPPRQQRYEEGDARNWQMSPPQDRQPPPRQQYGQEPMNDNGRMGRSDPRGQNNGHRQNREHVQPASKPPRRGRAQLSPISPVVLSQDNPFPTFPTPKAAAAKQKPKPAPVSMDEAMSMMNLGSQDDNKGKQRVPERQRGQQQVRGRDQRHPPQGRGHQGRGQEYSRDPRQGQNQGPPGREQDYDPSQGEYGPNRGDYGPSRGHYGTAKGGYGPRRGDYGPSEGDYGPNQEYLPQGRGPPWRAQGYGPNSTLEENRSPPRRSQDHGPNAEYVQNQGRHEVAQAYSLDLRQDSGHFEGGNNYGQHHQTDSRYGPSKPSLMLSETAGAPSHRQQFDPASLPQPSFEPHMQRAHTMPQNTNGAMGGGGFDFQWAEPGSAAGYHGPESPAYLPQRPSTASGSRQVGSFGSQSDHRAPPRQQVAPVPQQQQYSQEEGLDTFYDDYYGDDAPPNRGSKASIDMPNFDAIQESGTRHRRGFSIENHLSPTSVALPAQGITQATAGQYQALPPPNQSFQQQAARSRSQPDLHGQYQEGAVYEMAGDVPKIPQLPRSNTNFSVPNGLPSDPRGRGGPPQRGMPPNAASGRGPPPGQGYPGPGSAPQNPDPRYGRPPLPIQRGFSDASQWSDPGPHGMRNPTPMQGTPIQRPGTTAPTPQRYPSDPLHQRPGTAQPQRNNPDALPAHPVPVRPGLVQQQQEPTPSPPPSRPPPVRQYITDPNTIGYANQQSLPAPSQQRASVAHPVTHDELNRLRNTWKANPADHTTGLKLAKRLVEAATVLADEGGKADTRTKNKNREKFIFEAHKTVKKLVSSGSTEAMFYLADAYGRGGLGLQVDTKEAFTLYQGAAKAGHAAAAYRTAVCCEMGHEEGGGTKKDPLKAVQWYRRAAALGDTPALYKMGMILLKGLLGQQKNIGEAINMLKRAADRADEENPHALHELGLLYEAQTGNERIIRDESYALSLFKQAAELGYKFSQFRLGEAYEYGLLGLPIDARSSIAWYTRAAAQEEHQSELALSGWYLTGVQGILEQSDTEAYLWARKAACAEPPLAKALFAMGYFTEVGIGCPRSLDEAKRWYGRAAAYKFPKAQERLEELKRGGTRAQKNRERLSRTNQTQHEQENCVVM
ncbi:hypothetical protein GQ43DRAFT_431721 [Delitschia confertaspora ATCC 74209]|uniref:Sel1 repeat protein n=1 Tax=Delitschia confertaspora ATCC 74209 TaxID=1513339 RepID=A0A9P4JKW1_9PLEO|nr:hypothetical protein GQ43DRAFT_431721 [Delitschia confertaspora ATCC 74209]